jgi:hypothetical protein
MFAPLWSCLIILHMKRDRLQGSVIYWLVRGVGPPWKISPLRRPPKVSPEEYASLCVFKRWYDLSYRQVGDMTPLLDLI